MRTRRWRLSLFLGSKRSLIANPIFFLEKILKLGAILGSLEGISKGRLSSVWAAILFFYPLFSSHFYSTQVVV